MSQSLKVSSILNFLLEELELHLPDDLLEQAEQLLERQQLAPVREVERNLWLTQTLTPPNLEVEIQISPSKVKAYSCDCSTYHEQSICSHIIAGLLLVRAQRKAKRAQKMKANKRKASPKKLTISTILDQVQTTELKAFIKTYAKENKNFAIALKAKFAPTVSLPNSLEKYSNLLDSTINSVRRQALRFSKKASVQILKVSEEMLRHAEDALLIDNYSESFAICQSLFAKIIPLLPKAEDKNDFNRVIQYSLTLLKKLTHAPLAPQLKENIWTYLCQEAFAPSSRLAGYDQHFLSILLTFSNNNKQWSEQATLLVDEALSERDLNQNVQIHLLLAKMTLLDRSKKKEAFNALIQQNLSNPEVLQLALQKADENGEHERKKQLAELGYQHFVDDRPFFEEALLEVALATNDQGAIQQWAVKRFLDIYDFRYIELLKTNFPKYWPSIRTDLIQALKQQVFSIEQRDALARLLAVEELQEQLFQYLSSIRSLDLLPQYDQLLKPNYEAGIQQLYVELTTAYLNTHLGRQPSIRIRKLLEHLKSEGEHQ
ncbi:MAG: hypothetical protein AAGD05_16560, partial [Bacteroidota bacterium]